MKNLQSIIMLILFIVFIAPTTINAVTPDQKQPWNNTNIVIATVTIVGLLTTIYKKEDISEWLADLMLGTTKEQKHIEKSINITEIPWDKNYEKNLKKLLQKQQ